MNKFVAGKYFYFPGVQCVKCSRETRGQKRMGRLGPKVYAGGKWTKLTTMKVVFRYGVREKLEKTRGKKRGRTELGNSLKLKGRLKFVVICSRVARN